MNTTSCLKSLEYWSNRLGPAGVRRSEVVYVLRTRRSPPSRSLRQKVAGPRPGALIRGRRRRGARRRGRAARRAPNATRPRTRHRAPAHAPSRNHVLQVHDNHRAISILLSPPLARDDFMSRPLLCRALRVQNELVVSELHNSLSSELRRLRLSGEARCVSSSRVCVVYAL